MANTVFVSEFSDRLKAESLSIREILRYMQVGSSTEESMSLIEKCAEECVKNIKAKVCFAEFDVKLASNETDTLYIGNLKIKSRDLSKNLSGCDKAIIFAATIGLEFDRLSAKYSAVSPSMALCIGAIGNERVEALCDVFCDEIKKKYKNVHQRFSPGYGDLSLSLQKYIFGLLDCPKNIGAFLSDSLLITPAKSVTAIIGVESGN